MGAFDGASMEAVISALVSPRMTVAATPKGMPASGALIGKALKRYVPAGGLLTTMYSTLSTLETDRYCAHGPVQPSIWSAHRSRSHMTARLAPALAGSSSHVITTYKRLVPGGTIKSR